MLVLAMLTTILPENVQAAVYTPGLTTDFAQLEPVAAFQTYGKAGPGGAGILNTNTVLTIPEGDIVYLILRIKRIINGKNRTIKKGYLISQAPHCLICLERLSDA